VRPVDERSSFHRPKITKTAITEVRELLAGNNRGIVQRVVPQRHAEPSRARIMEVYLTKSCCGFNFPGDQQSLRSILEKLGIEVYSSDQQSCCGGAPYYMGGIGYADRQLLCARNFSVIHDTMDHGDAVAIAGICPTCFDSYTTSGAVLAVQENRGRINGILNRIGRTLPPTDRIRLLHSIDLYSAFGDDIKRLITERLTGLTVGMHLSCHYRNQRRGPGPFSDMKDLVQISGARVVMSGLEGYCCGGVKNLFDRYLSGRRDHPSLLSRGKKRTWSESGADLMVVDCPGCQLVLDQMGMPTVHIAQLLALATGEDPDRTVCISQGITSAKTALENAGIL
jgi:heterodisulfide reductase subunit B